MASVLRQYTQNLKDRCIRAESNNATRANYYETYLHEQEAYNNANASLFKLLQLHKVCDKCVVEYKQRRQTELESRIESVLALAFPDYNYGVKFKYGLSYNKEVATLLIGKKGLNSDTWESPVTSNGGMAQCVIAAATIIALTIMKDGNFILLDEAFASSDEVNCGSLKPLFDELLARNFQILLVEFKPELYNKLKRREFSLGLASSDNIKVLDVNDYTGEEDLQNEY